MLRRLHMGIGVVLLMEGGREGNISPLLLVHLLLERLLLLVVPGFGLELRRGVC